MPGSDSAQAVVAGILQHRQEPLAAVAGAPFGGHDTRLELFQRLLDTTEPNLIVETGAGLGETTRFMAERSGLPIYSAERDPWSYGYASSALEPLRDQVQLDLNESGDFLTRLAADPSVPSQRALFCFNSHWDGPAELEEIAGIALENWSDSTLLLEVDGDQGAIVCSADRRAECLAEIRQAFEHRPMGALIVVFAHHWIFHNMARALADSIAAEGFETRLVLGSSALAKLVEPWSEALWVGFWAEVPPRLLPRRYVFFNTEPLAQERWQSEAWRDAIRGAEAVWEYSPLNSPHLHELGVGHHLVPFGYSQLYETRFRRNVEEVGVEEPVDVLFYGGISARRGEILDRLRSRGLEVRTASWDEPLVGRALDRELARSRVVLCMFHEDDEATWTNDLPRLAPLLANRVFAVVEAPSEGELLAPEASGLALCAFDELVDRCCDYAARDAPRRARAQASYDWFRRYYSLGEHIPFDQLSRLAAEPQKQWMQRP